MDQLIVFVGDKPSSKNISPDIAFVGTPSYRVLLGWIADMQLSINNIVLVNKDRVLPGTKYVALGREAAKELESRGHRYFMLPHPSPRNRLTNDKNYVKMQLMKCKEYLK